MADETRTPRVRDVMTPLPSGVNPDDALRDASVRSTALGVDPLPVTENRRLVGQIGAGDMRARAAKSGLATGDVRVRDVMEAPQNVLGADEALGDAAGEVTGAGTHAFVVDADQNLLGTVPIEVIRKHLDERAPDAGITAVVEVESVSGLVQFEQDRVDYMSDESFPASDPIPPPGSLGPDEPDH